MKEREETLGLSMDLAESLHPFLFPAKSLLLRWHLREIICLQDDVLKIAIFQGVC